jgi:hypothetical protein
MADIFWHSSWHHSDLLQDPVWPTHLLVGELKILHDKFLEECNSALMYETCYTFLYGCHHIIWYKIYALNFIAVKNELWEKLDLFGQLF